MVRDPFYRQILAALEEGELNPRTFEACMVDVLGKAFPNLVPVPGGSDAGFDGAFADAAGEFPLVCTTGSKAGENLTKSLKSAKKNSPARRAAFATSRRLTPQQRTKLKRLARQEGFIMMLLVEQRGVADRLYRNTDWCKDLLGLDGRPSPLSIVPITRRPLIEIEPVGREKDLEWLRAARQDCVLSGEPGSGKTFLLYHLMQHGWPGLFLSSRDFDETAIANACRDQKPKFIVVDDAHADPERLDHLRRLRQEIRASFHIIATTWTGGCDRVVNALCASASQVRRLELLTRDEILKVIKQVGVREDEDDGILRHMVDQASNKPGLAVTIATLWLQGAWQEFIEGTALSRSLRTFFEKFVDGESTDVLAAVSLGGDRGMPQDAVREFLEIRPSRFRRITSGLAAGGVLFERGDNILVVRPPALRAPLMRSVFFPDEGLGSDYRPLLKKVSSLGSAVEALVVARRQGARIPSGELRDLVSEASSPIAWNWLASISEDNALWALQNYPGDVTSVARGALETAPEPTVQRLLGRAMTAAGPLNSQPDHPIRILQDWVKELNISLDEMISRRMLLAKTSRRFLDNGGERSVAVQGLCLALTPGLESHRRGAGSGDVLNIRWGLMPLECILRMDEVWKEVSESLDGFGLDVWPYLSAALWEWLYPHYSGQGVEVPDEVERAMRSFSEKALRCLSGLVSGSAGLISDLVHFGEKIGIELSLEKEEAFEILFPPHSDNVYADEVTGNYRVPLQELARAWASATPDEVAQRIVRYEWEARAINRRWPRRLPELASTFAALVDEPIVWIEAFSRRDVPDDVIRPFLGYVVNAREMAWEAHIEFLSNRPGYLSLVAGEILQHPAPPMPFLVRLIEKLASRPDLVELFCLRKQVAVETLRLILCRPERELALAAAVGEWASDPLGKVRAEVEAEWRSAILRAETSEVPGGIENRELAHGLADILASDPALAFDWLMARLQGPAPSFFVSESDPMSRAVAGLSQEQRRKLLDAVGRETRSGGFLARLIGGIRPEGAG
ncbi:MAG TPA: hypothetical protein VH988_26625 [Thermoanaerobaculia bacterium]|jgi:hypothetical protein|nr:hypothetical protein [Thermoanaerobaculia bacterium]